MKSMKAMRVMKVMKAMKAMKAMKTMKKAMKAMKVSKIAKGKRSKASVFFGSKKKTALMKSKSGKIVTRKSHAAGKRAYKNIKGWTDAVQKARKELGVKGFVAVKKGTPLYKAAKAHYNA